MELFTLDALYADGMIIQRNRPIYITGEIFDTATLTAQLGEDSVTQNCAAGKFSLALPPREAGTGLVLTVTANAQTITVRDIYCGEVWLAGGQSNMEWPMTGTAEYHHTPIKSNANIRFYTVGRNTFATPAEYGESRQWAFNHDSGWQGCDTETAKYFSAVGYHFAQNLYQALAVPIGVINCNVGGSSIYSWLPPEVVRDNADTHFVWAQQEALVQSLDPQVCRAAFNRYLDSNKMYFASPTNVSGTQNAFSLVYYGVPGPYNFQRPGGLYSAMLEKVIRFPVRGLIWYQGETDAQPDRAPVYASAMRSLTAHLQSRQPDGYTDYAFHFVQLAPWTNPDAKCWADVCEQQRYFYVNHPGSGMVTIGDCGGGTDIHPPRKQPVGERLANAALSLQYGLPRAFCGPVAVKAVRTAGFVRIDFMHDHGLHRKGSLGRFELAGADGLFTQAEAEIRDGAVYVSCALTPSPVWVRYEYVSDAQIGLYNSADLPASVFKLFITPEM